MTSRRTVWAALAAGVVAALALGCFGKSPKPTYYTLGTTAGAASGAPLAELAELGLAVGPIEIPRYLDRPEVVTRDGSHRLVPLNAHRWGGSLRNDVLRVLGDDLGRLLGTSRVAVYPNESRFPIDYRVLVEVLAFEGVPGDSVTLRARWTVASASDGSALRVEQSEIAEATAGPGAAAVVAAQGRALGVLGREIATAIAGLGDPKAVRAKRPATGAQPGRRPPR